MPWQLDREQVRIMSVEDRETKEVRHRQKHHDEEIESMQEAS